MTDEVALALADSPRFMPLALGDVRSKRLRVKIIRGRRPDILQLALSGDKVAGGEGSLSSHLIRVAAGDQSFVALPVFLQRAFVARYLYKKRGDDRDLFSECRQLRIGMYSWNATGTVWLRHFLRWLGVEIERMAWVIGPVDSVTDRSGHVAPELPICATAAGADLTTLLARGQIDLMFSAETPLVATAHCSPLVRFFEDARAVERRYYASTGIFPPQHVLILRRPVLENAPWIATEIERQFKLAEQLFLRNQAHNPFATPWEALDREDVASMMGDRYFSHGLRPNRLAMQAFIETAQSDGLIGRAMDVEDVFRRPA